MIAPDQRAVNRFCVTLLVEAEKCPRSRSSAPAARCSPRTCSATSSASRSWPSAEIACSTSTPERLRMSELVARALSTSMGAHADIEATTDRRRALDGADYAINMIQVGGYKPGTVTDFEIPKKYGLRQTIADTLGIGGIMRGLRTIPVLLDMCRDMEAAVPRRDVPQLHQPDGDQLLGDEPGDAGSRRWGCATACRARRSSCARDIGVPYQRDQLPLRGHQPHGLLPALRARRRGPLPAHPRRWSAEGACRERTACATRC